MVSRPDMRILDADLHHHFRWSDLFSYLPEGTRMPYYGGEPVPKVTGAFREDTISPRGGPPASDPEFVVEDHLNRWGIDYAILSCGSTLALNALPDVDFAGAIARAANDWTIENWFPVDERYLGAVTICANNAEQAAEEIRRVGTNPRMVTVVCTNPPTLLGQAPMHPIYEACSDVGLPLTLHPGALNLFAGRPVSGPTSRCEYRATMGLMGIQHVASLLFEGVFVRYPKFRFVLNEWGTAWLPFALWRFDMEYREHREEVPWLTSLPSEYVRDHIRFTTQPLEESGNKTGLSSLMGLIDGSDMLMFSSDYPHHDFDNPQVAASMFSDDARPNVFFENARAWYRLDERLGLADRVMAYVD
jgi:predicted TIM-barrel fold metal-dependent hydrolase